MPTDYSLHKCVQCGEDFFIDSNGVSMHVDDDGECDYDMDIDHIAYDFEHSA